MSFLCGYQDQITKRHKCHQKTKYSEKCYHESSTQAQWKTNFLNYQKCFCCNFEKHFFRKYGFVCRVKITDAHLELCLEKVLPPYFKHVQTILSKTYGIQGAI